VARSLGRSPKMWHKVSSNLWVLIKGYSRLFLVWQHISTLLYRGGNQSNLSTNSIRRKAAFSERFELLSFRPLALSLGFPFSIFISCRIDFYFCGWGVYRSMINVQSAGVDKILLDGGLFVYFLPLHDTFPPQSGQKSNRDVHVGAASRHREKYYHE